MEKNDDYLFMMYLLLTDSKKKIFIFNKKINIKY